jgi:hypothetical protein
MNICELGVFSHEFFKVQVYYLTFLVSFDLVVRKKLYLRHKNII